MLAWNLYADDNEGKIVNGNTGTGSANKDGTCWVYWPGQGASEQERIQGIKDGLLYKYCPNVKLYRCPTGLFGEVVTYAVVDGMNGHDAIPGAAGKIIKSRMEIRRPSERAVFLDEGRLKSGELDHLVRPGAMVGPNYGATRRRDKLLFCRWAW